jgi:hypothetical protein
MRSSTPFLVFALCVSVPGCYTARVEVPSPVSPGVTEYKGEVLWSKFWGLKQEYPDVDNCRKQGMSEVKISSNLGFALITVLTLGIFSPVRAEWKCAPPTPTSGGLGPPGGAGT